MEYVADTVAIIRFMRGQRIGSDALQILREAKSGMHKIHISAISLMEVLYLSEKRRIDLPLKELLARIAESENYAVVPISKEIVLAAEEIDDIPELHDRILCATARYLQVPLLTNDHIISRSKHVTAIW